MIKIITGDARLDFAVSETLKEIKDSASLCGEFKAEKTEKGLKISKTAEGGYIGFCDTRALMRAIGIIAERKNETAFELYEEPKYEILGTMADVSRNAVMTLESVKKLIRLTAISGYNAMMLYTEDTYEIEGYPYFGHLRGRYTAEELRILDDYADALGIELIPCIQTLAHVNAFFEWQDSERFRDCDDIMLVGDEGVYTLIEAMLKTMSKNLRSRKINIGLDEAFMLGRGQYIERFGFKEKHKIMADHLERVTELCKKYGYAPRMWSDMFFRMTNDGVYRVMGHVVPDHIIESVPADQTLVYWEYIQVNRENYNDMFRQHKMFNNRIAFAGGDASWYGLVPLNKLARKSTIAAAKSIEDNDIKEIYVTMWGDDGAACSFFSTLTTLFIYGEACWTNADEADARSKARLTAVTGLDPEAMLDIEDVNNVPGRTLFEKTSANPSKYMFYENVLTGKYDCHIPKGCDAHFAAQAKRWHEEVEKAGEYGYIYESIAAFCDVLALKAEMGLRLTAAYKANDKALVSKIANEEIPEVIRRLGIFHDTLRAQWMKENKTFGFDVMDIRMGGLIGQLKTAGIILNEWLDGRIEKVEELEAPRIPVVTSDKVKGYDNGLLLENRWERVAGQDVTNMFGY